MAKDVRWPDIKKKLPGTSSTAGGHRFKLWFESALKIADAKKKKLKSPEWYLFGESNDNNNLTGKTTAQYRIFFTEKGVYLPEVLAVLKKTKPNKKDNIIWEKNKNIFTYYEQGTEDFKLKINLGSTGGKPSDPNAPSTEGQFSTKIPKPGSAQWTVIQEAITLKMFEHLIGGKKMGTKTTAGFGEQPQYTASTPEALKLQIKNKEINPNYEPQGFCNAVIRKSGWIGYWEHILHFAAYNKTLDKNGKKIPIPKGWLAHFQRQYEWIKDKKNKYVKSGTYAVYSYDGFMKFISDLVVQGDWPTWGSLSKKDSWNPADIWLVSSKTEMKKVKEALEKKTTIAQINVVLKQAFLKKIIVGISLKQTAPDGIHWELNNLAIDKLGKSTSKLPKVVYGKWDFQIPYVYEGRSKKGDFAIKTNNINFHNANNSYVCHLRTGSNKSALGNNTMDMLGGGAAGLGKLPGDLAWEWIMAHRLISGGFAATADIGLEKGMGWPHYRGAGGIIEKTFIPKDGDKPAKKNANYKYWSGRIKKIKEHADFLFSNSNDAIKSLNNLIQNISDLKHNGKNKPISTDTSACLQFVELAYLFATIKGIFGTADTGKKRFDLMAETFVYYSQKRGVAMKSHFGPFAKLS